MCRGIQASLKWGSNRRCLAAPHNAVVDDTILDAQAENPGFFGPGLRCRAVFKEADDPAIRQAQAVDTPIKEV